MKLIVGLGNPGTEYAETRHNAGFLAIDHFLRSKQAINCTTKFKGYICELHFSAAKHPEGPIKVFFMKPLSFMNSSGTVVAEVCHFYKLNAETDLLIVHDEVDLKFGELKLSFDSRPAGHNGVSDVVEKLGHQKFSRLRIGIDGRSSRSQVATEKYVLSRFKKEELEQLDKDILPKADRMLLEFLEK